MVQLKNPIHNFLLAASFAGPASLAGATGPGLMPKLKNNATGIECNSLQTFQLDTEQQFELIRNSNELNGRLRQSQARYEPGTGADYAFGLVVTDIQSASAIIEKTSPAKTVESIESTIASIRSSLSLQVKELAALLGVERPTIYSWMRGDAQPQTKNRESIKQLLRYAHIWDSISNRPIGKAVRDVLVGGKSAFELMQNNPTDLEMKNFFNDIASAMSKPRLTAREIAAKAGIDITRVKSQQHVIDAMTGKRFSMD